MAACVADCGACADPRGIDRLHMQSLSERAGVAGEMTVLGPDPGRSECRQSAGEPRDCPPTRAIVSVFRLVRTTALSFFRPLGPPLAPRHMHALEPERVWPYCPPERHQDSLEPDAVNAARPGSEEGRASRGARPIRPQGAPGRRCCFRLSRARSRSEDPSGPVVDAAGPARETGSWSPTRRCAASCGGEKRALAGYFRARHASAAGVECRDHPRFADRDWGLPRESGA